MTLTTARQLGSRPTIQDVPEATLTAAIEVLNRSGKGVGSADQGRLNNLKFALRLSTHRREGVGG